MRNRRCKWLASYAALLGMCASSTGCFLVPLRGESSFSSPPLNSFNAPPVPPLGQDSEDPPPTVPGPAPHSVPTELNKLALPAYIIEPPDILLIQVAPLGGELPRQPIAGEHLVRPDGTVDLGVYGSVRVAGMTLEEAKKAIDTHLHTQEGIKPDAVLGLVVDVFAYNSKFYYIIADGAGYGEQMIRLPFTGNETVLDAISQINGLPQMASKRRIWLARPGNPQGGCGQVYPIDWKAITRCAATGTNYQLFPGDRIYIESDRLMCLDGAIAKIVSPIERLFGVTLLGAVTIHRLQNMGRGALGGGGI